MSKVIRNVQGLYLEKGKFCMILPKNRRGPGGYLHEADSDELTEPSEPSGPDLDSTEGLLFISAAGRTEVVSLYLDRKPGYDFAFHGAHYNLYWYEDGGFSAYRQRGGPETAPFEIFAYRYEMADLVMGGSSYQAQLSLPVSLSFSQ